MGLQAERDIMRIIGRSLSPAGVPLHLVGVDPPPSRSKRIPKSAMVPPGTLRLVRSGVGCGGFRLWPWPLPTLRGVRGWGVVGGSSAMSVASRFLRSEGSQPSRLAFGCAFVFCSLATGSLKLIWPWVCAPVVVPRKLP